MHDRLGGVDGLISHELSQTGLLANPEAFACVKGEARHQLVQGDIDD